MRGATTAPAQDRRNDPPPADPAGAPLPRVADDGWREHVGEAAVEIDEEGRVLSATRGRLEPLGDLTDGIVGEHWVDRLRAGDRVVFLHALARVRGGEERVDARVSIRRDEAGLDWLDATIVLASLDGRLFLLAAPADEAEPDEGEADTANDMPSRADDEDAFAELAHELRTPLNAVMGFGQALEAGLFGELTDRQRDAVVNIVEASEHLVEVANAVLDAARLRDADAVIDFETAPVAPAIERSCAMVSAIAGRHEVTVVNRITERCGTARHDPAALRQIAVNLLSNAIKACEPDAVVGIEARRTVLDGVGGMEIAVHDEGRGMSDAEMARLGRRFGRDTACAGESTGGLGLPLVRRLVARHDGALRFSSRVGEGTIASVFLPDEAPEARTDERPGERVVALRRTVGDDEHETRGRRTA